MHPDAERIEELFIKYIHGDLTEQERLELDKYLAGSETLRSLYTQLTEGESFFRNDLKVFSEINETGDPQNAFLEEETATSSKAGWIRRWKPAAAAAVILIATAGIVTLFSLSRNKPAEIDDISVRYKNDVIPGKDRALLTLEDGSTILLDSAASGVLAKQANTRIRKQEDGHLVYEIVENNAPATETVYNTVSTPRGGQYHIILPDGSKAWLNAASSIRFPSAFTGAERSVEVSGEVYFEVAENKSVPFKVQIGEKAKIEVTGTHFNVMAYDDEVVIKTTLLEGSVKVSAGDQSCQLAPGQQAQLNRAGRLKMLENIDARSEMAWKDGYFQFEDASIETIMLRVARWYDVEIEYEGAITKKFTVLMLSRKLPVSGLLKLLELTGNVHFKIDERRITVLP